MKVCILLVLIGAIITAKFFSSSKEEATTKTTNKFPSINDVLTAQIYEHHVGQGKPNIFNFDLNVVEQRSEVANILICLNSSNIQLNDKEIEGFYGYGGYNPTFIKLKFKNGDIYDIKADEQNLIINGYYKDKSLVVSNCDNLTQFINTGWEGMKQNMRQETY